MLQDGHEVGPSFFDRRKILLLEFLATVNEWLKAHEGPFSLFQMFWGNIIARPLRCAAEHPGDCDSGCFDSDDCRDDFRCDRGVGQARRGSWGGYSGAAAEFVHIFCFLQRGNAAVLGEQIEKVPGVDEVAPTLILSDPKTLMIIYGIDYKRFNALSQGFIFRDGTAI